MQMLIQRRAEIALRSLQKIEQKQIDRSLRELSEQDRSTLQRSQKLHMLVSGFSGKKLFVYRGSTKLRLILSFDGETCVVEDLVDHDRIDRLVAKGEHA